MSDQTKAVTESSPDSQEEKSSTTDVTVEKTETSVEQEPENKNEGSSPKEQKAQEDIKTEPSKAVEQKPLSKKAEKRFQELVSKLKEKDEQLKQFSNQKTQNQELPVEYDENGDPIVDPNKLLEIAEQRAYKKAVEVVQRERQVQEYQNKVNEFISDAETVKDELESNKSLEKLASKVFQAENYVIDPVSGEQVFVPRRKMSDIVKELKQDFEGLSVEAKAEVETRIQQEAENSALRPSETSAQQQELTKEEINELLIKNPQKLARMLEKKLGFAN